MPEPNGRRLGDAGVCYLYFVATHKVARALYRSQAEVNNKELAPYQKSKLSAKAAQPFLCDRVLIELPNTPHFESSDSLKTSESQ
ncbi:MAG: hypothetical protein JWO91_2704 [Acidobacteriaceae bacterium]|jgi:hypothetical protein|nr:hypothetical protein [Acidobacteriaceae bacterium]